MNPYRIAGLPPSPLVLPEPRREPIAVLVKELQRPLRTIEHVRAFVDDRRLRPTWAETVDVYEDGGRWQVLYTCEVQERQATRVARVRLDRRSLLFYEAPAFPPALWFDEVRRQIREQCRPHVLVGDALRFQRVALRWFRGEHG